MLYESPKLVMTYFSLMLTFYVGLAHALSGLYGVASVNIERSHLLRSSGQRAPQYNDAIHYEVPTDAPARAIQSRVYVIMDSFKWSCASFNVDEDTERNITPFLC